MSGLPPGPPPGPPPPPPPGPPGAGDPQRRRTTRRVLITIVVLLVLLAGGCGVLAATVGLRAVEGLSAPVDVANDYLDAGRSGQDLAPHACSPDEAPRDEVVTSRGQQLGSVEINAGSSAEVEGTLTLESGAVVQVRVALLRAGDGWCVREVLVAGR